MAEIRVERLRKHFGPLVALDDVDFTFPDGMVTCLLGPSGCGKTTLMRIVAGLEQPSAGEVYFGPTRVTGLKPSQRNIGMVFQYPVVYRGISVYQNIELPLKSEQLTKAERTRRVEDVIDLLGLQASAGKDITQLDNGTRQKVAVARAVARQPRIILFDEPITNVDANAKLQLKRAFKELTSRLRQTIVYVTHDQTEAMTLADQIALMKDGRIVQCDAPRALYNRPADRFGGWFLGNPGMDFFPGRLTPDHGGAALLASALFPAPVSVRGPAVIEEDAVTVGIRPEHIRIVPPGTPGTMAGTLARKAITIGRQYLLTVTVGDQTLKAKVAPALGAALTPGTGVGVDLPLEWVTLFDAAGHRLEAALALPGSVPAPATAGEAVDVARGLSAG